LDHKEKDLALMEAMKESLKAKIIDVMILKNELFWMLQILTELVDKKRKRDKNSAIYTKEPH
jgi:hypothetical protein